MSRIKYQRKTEYQKASLWVILMRMTLVVQCLFFTFAFSFVKLSIFLRLSFFLSIIGILFFWWNPLSEADHPRGTSITILRVVLGPTIFIFGVEILSLGIESWFTSLF